MEQKHESETEKQILAFVAYGFVILLLAFAVYRNKFDGQLSNNNTDWGSFGDYMNPFISLLNLIALVYLTYLISQSDNKRAISDRQTQKTIALNQMRNEAVMEIAKTLDEIKKVVSIKNDKGYYEECSMNINSINTSLRFFRENYEYLFEGLFNSQFNKEYYSPLRQKCRELNEQYSKMNETIMAADKQEEYLYSLVNDDNEDDIQYDDDYEEAAKILNNLREDIKNERLILKGLHIQTSNCKAKFVGALHKFILREMIDF